MRKMKIKRKEIGTSLNPERELPLHLSLCAPKRGVDNTMSTTSAIDAF